MHDKKLIIEVKRKALEIRKWVIESVFKIRKKFTEILETLDDNSDIKPHLQGMIAACRKFIDKTEKQKPEMFLQKIQTVAELLKRIYRT